MNKIQRTKIQNPDVFRQSNSVGQSNPTEQANFCNDVLTIQESGILQNTFVLLKS